MAFHRATLWETILLRQSWYKQRFGLGHRVGALFKWVWSWAERLVWGYGERPLLLMAWGAALTFIFGIYYYASGLPDALGVDGSLAGRLGEAVTFSALAFVGNADRAPWPGGPTAAIAVQGALGIVFIGVFAAVVYRWISIRQG